MRKIKVLYAEDDILTRMEVKERMEEKGWEVVEAGDGVEAFRRYGEDSPDIVVLDVDMPGYTGFEVLQLIRSTDHETPVVIYSSLAEEKDLQTGYDVGVNNYLVKEYSPAILVAQIQNYLRDKQEDIIILGDQVSYDLRTNCLKTKDRTEKLSMLEGRIFVALCKNRNKLTERSLLLQIGWKTDDAQYQVQLNKVIGKLREILKKVPSVSIVTDRGNGYWLRSKSGGE